VTDIATGGSLQGDLGREFDLTSRAAGPAVRKYACRDEYLLLGPAGELVQRDVHSAQATCELNAAGMTCWYFEQLTYAHSSGEDTAEQDVLESVLRVVGSLEERDSYIPSLDDITLPRDERGWLAMEQAVHARMPAYFTSRSHGGVDNLHRVGDRVVMPCSGEEINVRFNDVIEIQLRRGVSELSFDGLSLVGGRPVALLSFACPFDLPRIAGGRGAGYLSGRVCLELADGSVASACWRQTNWILLPYEGHGQLSQVVEGRLDPR
jgi:hypothetical protein